MFWTFMYLKAEGTFKTNVLIPPVWNRNLIHYNVVWYDLSTLGALWNMLVWGMLGPSRGLVFLIVSDISGYCMFSEYVLVFLHLIYLIISLFCDLFMLIAHAAVFMTTMFPRKFQSLILHLHIPQFRTGTHFPKVSKLFSHFLFLKQSWNATCCLITDLLRFMTLA